MSEKKAKLAHNDVILSESTGVYECGSVAEVARTVCFLGEESKRAPTEQREAYTRVVLGVMNF